MDTLTSNNPLDPTSSVKRHCDIILRWSLWVNLIFQIFQIFQPTPAPVTAHKFSSHRHSEKNPGLVSTRTFTVKLKTKHIKDCWGDNLSSDGVAMVTVSSHPTITTTIYLQPGTRTPTNTPGSSEFLLYRPPGQGPGGGHRGLWFDYQDQHFVRRLQSE